MSPQALIAYDSERLAEKPESCSVTPYFIFSWPINEKCGFKPRGGTTSGPSVTLAETPYSAWLDLQRPGLSAFERDRQAILAMAGPYRTSFDFIETVGYVPGFQPDKPYQSWGTEYIYVVENKKDFISLQHIMVMFFEHEGKVMGPMVMKHWRQDWQYQKKQNLVYQGHQHWGLRAVPKNKVKGSWSQSVFQVDDSPRYESYGYWDHKPNFSTWVSAITWRPLPRREHSVRNDYHVLEGTNRHTILPTGWVQEEENYKVVLDKSAKPVEERPYLAKELGVNRYDRIQNHDFSAGNAYWKRTQAFWADVRNEWEAIIKKQKRFKLKTEVDGSALYEKLFRYAEQLKQTPYDSKSGKTYIRDTLKLHMSSAR